MMTKFISNLSAYWASCLPFVHLVVDEDNLAAIGLYRRVGFQEIGKCYMAYLR